MKNKIKFTYTGTDMKIRHDRKVHPYYIVINNMTMYLVGKSEKHDTVGLHILSQIEDLVVLDEKFNEEIPPAKNYFQHSHGAFIWNYSDPVQVKIRYASELESRIKEEFEHLSPEIKRYADHFEMSFSVHDYESVCRQLFFYGSGVEILSPAEVRDHMKQALEESLSVYI